MARLVGMAISTKFVSMTWPCIDGETGRDGGIDRPGNAMY
jgi:hypothetical protein